VQVGGSFVLKGFSQFSGLFRHAYASWSYLFAKKALMINQKALNMIKST